MSEFAAIGLSPEGIFKKQLSDKTHNGLRCFEIIDGEITGISFVNKPANTHKARIISEEDRIIGGPVLIPGQMIYRINPITGEEHYIFFTAEVIEMMHTRFRKKNWTENERQTLVTMSSEGRTAKEISIALNREETEIGDRVKQEGEAFIHMAIVLMSQKSKNIKQMAEILKIEEPEIRVIISKIGGNIVASRPDPDVS